MTFGRTCRVIWRLFQINMANTMAYRFEFVIYMLSTIITPVIGLAIWRASAASGAELPVSTTYLTTYFVISSLFALATSSWHDMFMPSMIREGKLSIWLMRPGSVFYEIFANNLAEKVIKFVVLLPMVAIFGWSFRDDLAIPADLLRWAGALVSLLLGAVFYFALAALTGTIGFWWEETNSVRTGIILVEGVLMGGIIPLALFPDWSQGFMDAQLFRYRFAFALDVLLRDMSTTELVMGFIWQVVWTAAMVAGAIWLWNRGRQSYVAVGG